MTLKLTIQKKLTAISVFLLLINLSPGASMHSRKQLGQMGAGERPLQLGVITFSPNCAPQGLGAHRPTRQRWACLQTTPSLPWTRHHRVPGTSLLLQSPRRAAAQAGMLLTKNDDHAVLDGLDLCL